LSRVDPFGFYHKDTHYYRTLNWAEQEAFFYLSLSQPRDLEWAICEARKFAEAVARADQWFDDNPQTSPNPIGGDPKRHFLSTAEAAKYAARANSTFELGSALHMVQDSYSHYSKGYRYPVCIFPSLPSGCAGFDIGHGITTLLGIYDPDQYTGGTLDQQMELKTRELIHDYLVRTYDSLGGGLRDAHSSSEAIGESTANAIISTPQDNGPMLRKYSQ